MAGRPGHVTVHQFFQRMNAKQMRELLATVPDDAILVRPGPDHSYREAELKVSTAIFYPRPVKRYCHISEDYGDEHNYPGGRRKQVLLVDISPCR